MLTQGVLGPFSLGPRALSRFDALPASVFGSNCSLPASAEPHRESWQSSLAAEGLPEQGLWGVCLSKQPVGSTTWQNEWGMNCLPATDRNSSAHKSMVAPVWVLTHSEITGEKASPFSSLRLLPSALPRSPRAQQSWPFSPAI